jgi:hypothetical protein
MDEDRAVVQRATALLSHTWAEGVALRMALTAHVPLAPFSDDFCPSPDIFLAGGLGLPSDLINVPPEVVPNTPRQRRDRLQASALRWVKDASIDVNE